VHSCGYKNKMIEYILGKSLVQILPFHRIPVTIKKQQDQKEIITTKLVITMVIIAIVKIAVLLIL
jgi:hypothetical protein